MRRLLLVGVGVACWALPRVAQAQSEAFGAIGVALTQSYAFNLLAVPNSRGQQQTDLVTRLGPILEGGYRSAPLTVVGRYQGGAERFWDHRTLDRRIASQDAAAELTFRPTRQLAVGASGEYIDTYTPLEMGTPDALVLGRVRAERLSIRPGLAWAWSPRATLGVEHEHAREALANEAAALVQTSTARLELTPTARTTYAIAYRARRFGPADASPEQTHALVVSYGRSLARSADVHIGAGPRAFAGAVRPEVVAEVRRRVRAHEFTLGFGESETSVLGERGIMEVRRIRAAAAFQFGRRVTLTAAPTVFRNKRGERLATIKGIEVETTARLSRSTTLLVTGLAGRHRGNLGGTLERIPYYTLSTSLRVAYPGERVRDQQADPQPIRRERERARALERERELEEERVRERRVGEAPELSEDP